MGWTGRGLWAQLPEQQQQQAQRVLTISRYVADALPREAAWFTTALLENRFIQPPDPPHDCRLAG